MTTASEMTAGLSPASEEQKILAAWQSATGRDLAYLKDTDLDDQGRLTSALAVHGLRTYLATAPERVAEIIDVPVTYVRLLTIEVNRALASSSHKYVWLRARRDRIRALYFGTPEKKRRPIAEKPMAPKGSLGKKVPEEIGELAMLRASHCFGVPSIDVRGPHQKRTAIAAGARRTAIALLHLVLLPELNKSQIAAFFHLPNKAVEEAVAAVEEFAKPHHPYHQCIEEYCKLYDVPMTALQKTVSADSS
jgi:hypothetical protein